MDRRFSFDRRSMLGTALALAGARWMPRDVVAQGADDRARGAMDACEDLSRLEATEHLPALYEFYARMHPDAQEIVPRHVVIGWYQDEWQPMGPREAVATGVRFVDWQWPVNGVTYSDVAEVSFNQTFENAPPISDVVRLAFAEGEWRWFFGRDRTWVESQIWHYNELAYIDQTGTVPWGLDRVAGAEPDIIRSLPAQIGRGSAEPVEGARMIPDYAEHMPVAVQYRDDIYPIGHALAATLKSGAGVPDTIDALIWDGIQTPPFTLKAWNLAPVDGVPFARYERFGNDAVGTMQELVFGGRDDRTLWTIAFTDDAGLEELARGLVALAGPRGA
jgi:hypothetical protein